ncbi:MAG: hypothetical protein KJZ86_13840 [Caldilineaceae bacterium]|nr:hypothetical protein [Caldilineaceae bacterium]HRJ44043.1 hypothetical protein [Caldilineaceae bacterium]
MDQPSPSQATRRTPASSNNLYSIGGIAAIPSAIPSAILGLVYIFYNRQALRSKRLPVTLAWIGIIANTGGAAPDGTFQLVERGAGAAGQR